MSNHYNNNPSLPKNFGLQVEVKNGNVEQAMRKLKKKIANDGKLMEIRERRYYQKPSEKRVKAEKQAKARHRREQARGQIDKRLY